MSNEQLAAIVAIVVPLVGGAVGYVVWRVQRRQEQQEALVAKGEAAEREERARRDSSDQERGRALLAREALLEAARATILGELETTATRLRNERNEARERVQELTVQHEAMRNEVAALRRVIEDREIDDRLNRKNASSLAIQLKERVDAIERDATRRLLAHARAREVEMRVMLAREGQLIDLLERHGIDVPPPSRMLPQGDE